MYCPHCKEEITELNYTSNYSETVYGRCNGTYDIENESHDINESESRDSDNWEEDDYEYECPECSHSVDIDELLESIDEDEQEEIDKQKEIDKQMRLLKFFKRS